MPLAVVTDIDTGAPKTLFVHADHLDRPIRMTDATKAVVWDAVYKPYGEVFSIAGPAALDARFPGQWFQLETGLAYNWHRHYDPTTGRYTSPDPLGFADGPSVYGYAGSSPLMKTDPTGLLVGGMTPIPRATQLCSLDDERCAQVVAQCRAECVGIYSGELPGTLPGVGHDMFGRLRRCIRECATREGCADYF